MLGLLAQGSSTQACQGIINVWDQNGKLENEGSTYNYTIPGGGGSIAPTANPAISQDLGVYKTSSYSVTANDYGAGGSRTLAGTQQVSFKSVPGAPAAGQYNFNPTTSTYTFAAADAGTVVTISYSLVFSLYYFEQTQGAEIPGSPYTISTNNQAYFSTDNGVTFADPTGNIAGIKVSGTPTATNEYSELVGFYTFYAGDAGRFVYIHYTYTSSDPSVTNSSSLNLTFFTGAQGQAPWSYMTSRYPSAAFGYSAMAYVGANPMALGESATLPSYNYEVVGLCVWGGGILDCHPCDFFRLVLTDPLLGVLFPSGNLDAWTNCYAYWASNNYFVSIYLNTQDSVSDALRNVIDVGNVAPVWSAGLLKLVPYGDTTTVGNGYTYTPPTTPVFVLTWDDLLPPSPHKTGEPISEDPVQWNQRAPQDCLNYMQAEWTNRENDYNNELTPAQNDAFISTYGFRPEAPQTWDFITTQNAATWALNLRLKRSCYIRNTGKMWLPFWFVALEPMDLVLLPTGEPVRITQVEDAPDGRLAIDIEQWTYGSADVTLYPNEPPLSYQPIMSQAIPGNATPIFIQNTVVQSSGILNKLQVAACGTNPNWGGCNVYVSLDNLSYTNIGTVTSPSIVGILTANLASSIDPDTTDTLSVDLTFSQPEAELVSVTLQQCNQFVSLCAIIDQSGLTNELIAYETSTLVAAGQYDLTYLRRGVYGTTAAAHTAGAAFAYLGAGFVFLDYQYTPNYAGQSLYVKLQSFNLAGNQAQDLSQCTVWNLFITNQGSSAVETYVPSANATVSTGTTWTINTPALAYDKNFSTIATVAAASSYPSNQGSAQVVYSGFGSTAIPSAMTLNVQLSNFQAAGDAQTLPGGATAFIRIQVSIDNGVTFGTIFYHTFTSGGTPQTGSTTASTTIPSGTNLTDIQVRITATATVGANVGNAATGSMDITEIWLQ